MSRASLFPLLFVLASVFATPPAVCAAGADLRPLLDGGRENWLADPLVWRFGREGVSCTLPNTRGLAVYEAAPLAEEVRIEAVFTPRRAEGDGWCIAAVALVENERNYWHLALVQTPEMHGRRPAVELCEMRDGNWHAQKNLKVAFEETGAKTWSFGSPCRLMLSMDRAGVTGSILASDGGVILRKRYVFSSSAVTRARPALHVAKITGEYRDLLAGWSSPVREQTVKIPAYDAPAGMPRIRDAATGFFRVIQKPDGRWWAVDPLGRGVVLLGVDHVTFNGHWCEALGYAPHGRKNEKKYPGHAAWEEETLGRLKQWGFNMLGAGCDPKLRHRGLIHCEFLGIGDRFASMGDEYDITPNEHRPGSAFPNIFHAGFEEYARHVARAKCRPARDDPWLFGYFIDNELAWWGRDWGSETGLFDAVMKKGASHTAKVALMDFLAARFGGIAAFNGIFGTGLNRFEDLLGLDSLPHATPGQREAKQAFLAFVAERYFAVASRVIREADPNHLVLGARFAGTDGTPPVVWEAAGRHCDVVTFNFYPMADLDEGRVYTHFGNTGELTTAHFAKYHGYVKRPMLVTEWSFPSLDAGLPSIHGAGQRFRTQAERTQATSLFARTMLSLPFLLGYDYFMWVDEPALGISTPNPEDSNYGLINEDGEPYELLTGMFAELHREAGAWRFKPEPLPNEGAKKHMAPPSPEAVIMACLNKGGAHPVSERTVADAGFQTQHDFINLAGYDKGMHKMVEHLALADDGRTVGQYNAMIRTVGADGRNRWTETKRMLGANMRMSHDNKVTVLTLTGAGEVDGCGFEVTHRLYQPAGRRWFIAEVESVRNTGNMPLNLKSLYFRLYSAFKETLPPLAPNLWKELPSGCWLDSAQGLYLGAVAPWRSHMRIHFWVDPDGRQHPDARLELPEPVNLEPGALFTPPAPAYVICLTGRGGPDAWRREIKEIRQMLDI